MGAGLVLESGTHNELLASGGAYANLVQAQKLRDHQERDDSDGDEKIDTEEKEDYAATARDEVPLGRRNTGHSLASEIVEQKRLALEGKEERDLSLPTLFKRMGLLAPDHWRTYLIGGFFACGMYISTHSRPSLEG